MSYWIDSGIKELKNWEQKVLAVLSETLSPKEIKHYLNEYKCDIRGFYEWAEKSEGLLARSIFNAIASLSQIRFLLKELKPPLPKNVSLEMAARFSVLSFRVGITTGMIAPGRGMDLFKPHAMTRLAQIQNQPKTRKRKNIAKDDIFLALEEYIQEKGHPPVNLPRFISYLDQNDYEIDEVKKTIYSRKWDKNRSFGTIDNWRREYRLNYINE
ncbi:MAG: hypothetical protein ACLQBQ_13625 [Smithella sp.]